MNDWKQQFLLRVLSFGIPFWLYCLPIAGFVNGLSGAGIVTACITIFFLFTTLRLARNRIIFKEDSLQLPGIFNTSYKYSDVEAIKVTGKQLTLLVKDSNGECKHLFSMGGEQGRLLWKLLSQNLKRARISPAVRNFLLVDQTSLVINNEKNPLEIDLKQHRLWWHFATYLNRYQSNVVVSWVSFWIGLPLLCFAFSMMRIFLPFGWSYQLGAIAERVFEIVISLSSPFQAALYLSFANVPSAIATIAILAVTVAFIFKASREPDSVAITKQGIVLESHAAGSTVNRGEICWSDLKHVNVLRRSQNIVFQQQEKIQFVGPNRAIEIPLRALSNKQREVILEAISQLSPEAEIEPAVVNLLAPVSDSYTELWLSSFSSAPQIEELTPLLTGTALSGIVIKDRLASGGQCVTYLAASDNKTVVLKEIILPIYNDKARAAVIARFERDAKLLLTLDHPQIVKLHKYFVDGHRAFLVLEYVEGMTLKSRVMKEKLSEKEALPLIEQMVGILEYLHGRSPQVVHRDFTPDNLLLSSDGKLKLIDFDVALQTDSVNKATIVGKQNYLPPEQFRGKPTSQSDIYALGATIHFMLTASEPEALKSCHPKEEVQDLSDFIDQLAARCTEPDLAKRFIDCAALRQYLRQEAVNVI